MFASTSYIAVKIKCENLCKKLAYIKNFISGRYYYYPLWVVLNIAAILNLMWKRWEVQVSGLEGE